METTTQELIYQIMLLVVSGVFAVIGTALKKWITQRIDFEKYGFENDRIERIIDNGVNFAEQKAKDFSKKQAIKLSETEKLARAKEYINKIDKNIVVKYGNELDDMIERKVMQKFGAKNDKDNIAAIK